ncbi:MAG: hypothetical protein H7Y88_09395, partial [Phycisphaerales bacterium]|nr:hypothetical protein [Phycisphaerales bacterium]
ELVELRGAVVGAIDDAARGGPEQPEAESQVMRAAQAYAVEFERWHAEPGHRQDEQGMRAPAAWVSVSCVGLPVDAVVRSSLMAAHAVRARMGGGGGMPTITGASRILTALVVRRMGIQPGAAR